MSHHLIELEDVCNEIREKLASLGVANAPSLTLAELLSDERLRSTAVTEEFLKTYIEKDFGVGRWHVVYCSR